MSQTGKKQQSTISLRFWHIQVKRKFAASAHELWDILTDTQQWSEWGPSVLAVESSERYIKLHSTGKVLTALGWWAPFKVTEFEDGRYWSWHVHGVRATGHRVIPEGVDRCSVVFEIPTLAAPYLYVCDLALDRIEKLLADKNSANASDG